MVFVSRSPPPRYGRDMGPPRYRSPVRSRRPAPSTGLHLFAAGLNFIINERVRHGAVATLSACFACNHSSHSFALCCKHDADDCLRVHSLQDLEKKFEKYGPVREARIVRNPRSGESRGFGFLIMENDDDVDRVSFHHALHIPFSEQAAIHLLHHGLHALHCSYCAGNSSFRWERLERAPLAGGAC